MKITKPKRSGRGAKRMDPQALRELLKDSRLHCIRAKVWKPPGETTHWAAEKDSGGNTFILVHVLTIPHAIDLTCRLGSQVAGGGQGLWRIPDIGTEVAVENPDGALEFEPTIIGVMDSGNPPSRVGTNRTILVANDIVEITAPKVYLGPTPEVIVEASDGLVHGSGIDSFTGATYFALQNTTAKVFCKK